MGTDKLEHTCLLVHCWTSGNTYELTYLQDVAIRKLLGWSEEGPELEVIELGMRTAPLGSIVQH